MKARVLGGIGLAVTLLVTGCQQSDKGEISYSDQYIRASIANNEATSGYITLINGKQESIELTGAAVSSDIAARVELHGHSIKDGMVKMYEVKGLDLPPGKPVKLEPGGYHVMLMGLKQGLEPGTEVDVKLSFSNGETLAVSMPVKAMQNVQMERRAVSDNNALDISNISVRAAMPGMDTSAAYMTIDNQGEEVLSLVSASSPLARKTELHTTVMENGTMKMKHIPALEIKPGDRAVLKPGGHHIMLMGLKETIKEGSEVPLELKFSDGSVMQFKAVAMKKIPGQLVAH
ncbi:copper chaperone PCu(A)C [Endozoicomonas sp. Mp262]|uniref:copper chaperone PCu(A)C n=1 Tax=Endozoicomonas sp. Mp262 TaxID=2919499 RepID=UPI0021D91B4D